MCEFDNDNDAFLVMGACVGDAEVFARHARHGNAFTKISMARRTTVLLSHERKAKKKSVLAPSSAQIFFFLLG